MFPVKHSEEALVRAATWAGLRLHPTHLAQLLEFGEWLAMEAIPAGGLGPDEEPRIVDRHLADSLTFAQPWGARAPATLLDVGSGVGLPGIPLAIVYPGTTVTLLDRSGRRTELARRAVRVLGLDNVRAVQEEVTEHGERYPAVTVRAAMPVDRAVVAAGQVLTPHGIAVIGLSRDRAPDRLPDPGDAVELGVIHVPEGVLDSPAWNLRMSMT